MGAPLGEPGGVKEGSGYGHLFPWSNLGDGSYAGGLCVEEGSGMGVSPYRGLVGGPGEGGPSTGNFER